MIAYSTMSQIGYMVMGVSVAAYSAGLFHLMTHAFFKALLFMGAGSVIGAMAGIQDMDRMGGFRQARCRSRRDVHDRRAHAGRLPVPSGFFSKDEILAFTINRGGGYWCWRSRYIGGRADSVLAFRMVFGSSAASVPEARELEGGHLAHGEPGNPRPASPRTPTSASPARSTTWPSASGR